MPPDLCEPEEETLCELAVRRFSGLLRLLISRKVPEPDRDDVLQEIYRRLVSHRELPRDPRAYVSTVAKSAICDYYRRKSLRDALVRVDSDLAHEAAEVTLVTYEDEPAEALMSEQELRFFLSQLSDPEYAAVILYAQEGWSPARIAAVMRSDADTVKRLLRKVNRDCDRKQAAKRRGP